MDSSSGAVAGGLDGESGVNTVVPLALFKRDLVDVLGDDAPYWQAVGLIGRLTEFGDGQAVGDLDIVRYGQFWCLKLTSGFLKTRDLRIYFAHMTERKEIVVLMAYEKEKGIRISPHVPATLEDRFEEYVNGTAQRIGAYGVENDGWSTET